MESVAPGRSCAALACMAFAAIASAAAGQQPPAWKPERNVEIVVSAGPGGNQDQTARTIQAIWQEKKTVPLSIVTNKPGGGGAIAYTYVSQHPRDPHYLLMLAPTLFSSRVMGQIKFQHTDFTPVATLFEEYLFVSVRSDSPIRTGRDLIERLKTKPDSLSIALATALGNHLHLGLALPMKAAGVDIRRMLMVPYKSSGESLTALLGGHIDVAISTFGTVLPHLEAGRIRVIGVSAPRRLTGILANVPTWREQGADAVFSSWRGMAAPKGIGDAQVQYWESALQTMAATDEWKKDVEKNFRVNRFLNGRESSKYWDEQYREVESALTEIGLAKTAN